MRFVQLRSGEIGNELITTRFAVFDCDPGVIGSNEALSAVGDDRVTESRFKDFAETRRCTDYPTGRQTRREPVKGSIKRVGRARCVPL